MRYKIRACYESMADDDVAEILNALGDLADKLPKGSTTFKKINKSQMFIEFSMDIFTDDDIDDFLHREIRQFIADRGLITFFCSRSDECLVLSLQRI